MQNANPLTLWTIQTLEWYEILIKNGTIRTDISKIDSDFQYAYHYAYQWLSTIMQDKIATPSWLAKSSKKQPLWAWYQYLGEDKKRPDLRFSGHLNKGEVGVRIEFTKPASQVLLSDFDLWHAVLNNWYLADSEMDDNVFYNLLEARGIQNSYNPRTNPQDIQAIIEHSWLKVFDLDYYSDYACPPIKQKSIQATFWELSVEEIVKVDRFIAR